MTYKQLLNQLRYMSEEDLNKPVTILLVDAGEFTGIDETGIVYSDDTDTLDNGSPYLMIKD